MTLCHIIFKWTGLDSMEKDITQITYDKALLVFETALKSVSSTRDISFTYVGGSTK